MRFIQITGSVLRLFGFFVLAGVVTNALIPLLSGYSLESISHISFIKQHPDLFYSFAISDLIGKVFGFILLPVVYLSITKEPDANPFKQSPLLPFDPVNILFGAGILLSCLPWIGWLADINKAIHLPERMNVLEELIIRTEAFGEAITNLFMEVHTPLDFMLAVTAIAVIPAIGEEFIFRGLFQRELQRYTGNMHLAVWVAAFVFSFIHFQFYGFFARMALGAVFGYMLVWSGSMWVPITMHFFNNALTLCWMLAYKKNHTTLNPENGDQIPSAVVITALAITLYLLYNRKKVFDLFSKTTSLSSYE